MSELFQHINMYCSLSPQYMGQGNISSLSKRNTKKTVLYINFWIIIQLNLPNPSKTSFGRLYFIWSFSSVQSLSHVWLLVNAWTTLHQVSLSITNSWSPSKPMSIEVVMPSNHFILCCLLLLPSIFPRIRVFSNGSALHVRWPKYWNFSFNISPSNEHPGLISFRMDCLDLPAVQGTLKSLFQHPALKSIFSYLDSFH